MLLLSLLIIPIIGLSVIYTGMYDEPSSSNIKHIKIIGLITSIVNLFISLLMFIFFDFSSNNFQFVQEYHSISSFDFYLGVDGLSIYFVLLTTIIMPVALLSNWTSISENVRSYVIIILLLESLLLANFLVLDILLFYIFFESILPPLFILIGLFGSKNRTRASFYLFLYTLTLIRGVLTLPLNQCSRAKLRKSPKALVTKDNRETFYPAPLMPGGMVTSLKINLIKWVIADLNQKLKNNFLISVKEQRVDGSSTPKLILNSKNTYCMRQGVVRCTLVAGKPVLGRNTFLNNINGIKRAGFHSTNTPCNSIIQSSTSISPVVDLNPWFVTGFIDAEGCFSLVLTPSNRYKQGYQVNLIFSISMLYKDLLTQINKYFGVGNIAKHGAFSVQYRVTSFKDMGVILSHCDNYPLISKKRIDF